MSKVSFSLVLLLLISRWSHAQTFPANFSRDQVGGTLTSPTVMAFANDGRIFVAEQAGSLRVIKNDALLTTPFITLAVNANGERGLIGIALDPDFATNNFLYLYYTVNTAPIHNRISRFTANGDVVVANSEQIILELDNLSGATNHNGGALAFGLDGRLYVAVGENANTANSQNLDTYLGKILRISKDGSAPTDNPFYSSGASEQRKRIWSYGLRNPYTFSIQPVTGKIFINEVGQNTWEEINDASVGGRNFGWPTTEGVTTNPSFTSPLYAYNHNSGSPTGCAITGGTFFNPIATNYPSQYTGKYFFQDYCTNWVYWIDPTVTSPTATLFGSSVGGTSLSITTGIDGNLYYLSRGSNRLYRIKYTPPTVAPSIVQQPTAIAVSVGQIALFSVVASGTAPLTYQWQKDNVDIQSATQSTFTISQTQLADAGSYRVIVTNAVGTITSSSALLTVNALNQKPSAIILSPTKGTLYTAGTTINFSGQGTDPEEGDLLASAFSWQINFHHDVHKHDQPPISGVKQSSFDIPNQGETSDNVWYRIILTVKDAQGLEGKDSVDVYPKKSTITLATIPSGLQLTLDGQPFISPISVVSVQGLLRAIGVVSPQNVDNKQYEFASWSSGGSADQTIATPVSNLTYTATFSIILGTEDNVSQSKPFPNPATEWLNLGKRDTAIISLQDIMGRVWDTPTEQTNEDVAIYVGHLPSGLYFLRLGSSQEGHKIIIQH
jgi:glucose/arabinose dehydrogenase